MGERSKESALKSRTVDYVLSAARAAVGPIPIVGPLISELVGTVVPNQRVERIAKFLEELERRVRELESPETITEQLRDESFTDLLEEGCRQAARSLSDERREYIASVICNGLSSERIRYVESRHLLRILDEVNDIEIIWLRFYREAVLDGDADFRNKHTEVLDPAVAYLGSSQSDTDKATLQESYKQHLARLGLLEPTYRTDFDTRKPQFDEWSGRPETTGYEITSLGRLLLRQIGLDNSE